MKKTALNLRIIESKALVETFQKSRLSRVFREAQEAFEAKVVLMNHLLMEWLRVPRPVLIH